MLAVFYNLLVLCSPLQYFIFSPPLTLLFLGQALPNHGIETTGLWLFPLHQHPQERKEPQGSIREVKFTSLLLLLYRVIGSCLQAQITQLITVLICSVLIQCSSSVDLKILQKGSITSISQTGKLRQRGEMTYWRSLNQRTEDPRQESRSLKSQCNAV